jgi:hypothetical protein
VTQLGESRALPRADAANVRALNRLYGAAPLPDVATRGVRYRIHWHHDAAFGHTTRESYRFRLGAHVGHLAMDAPSLQALLGERRIDLLPRDLRYILLADALHPVVDALEKALRLHFEWQPSEAEAATHTSARARANMRRSCTATPSARSSSLPHLRTAAPCCAASCSSRMPPRWMHWCRRAARRYQQRMRSMPSTRCAFP